MRSPRPLKHEFLKKWTVGLKVCDSTKKNMTIMERKKAIKLSADIAMASTRTGTKYWSQALIAKASRDDNNRILIEHILACDDPERRIKLSSIGKVNNKRVSSKILKKSRRCMKRVRCIPKMVITKSLAKQMVKKRTQVLKSLVPGGEFMDDISLIEETLDYVVSLRAQVDVMRTATELLYRK